jgi:sulfonate transport system ATP-binding protein
MGNKLVSVKGLEVKYKEDVLKGIFFEIGKGEFVSIIGKSGIGKTTLLNAIAGLTPHAGEIHAPPKIAFVFQHDSLFPWMTVRENILFGNEKLTIEEMESVLVSIGLQGKEDAYPSQLSGGQQQRVAIARALSAKPDLLLLDEPFSSLDTFTKLQLQEWLQGLLQKNKTTTLLVTHDVEEAILLSDRVMALKNKTLEHEFTIPMLRPRNNNLRYEESFQQLKKKIIETTY